MHLGEAWRQAWANLPADVHRGLTNAQGLPKPKLVGVLFPSLYPGLEPWLRSKTAMVSFDPLTDGHVRQIHEAVASSRETLARIVAVATLLSPQTTTAALRRESKQDGVYRAACDKVLAAPVDADPSDLVDEILDELDLTRGAPHSGGVVEALRDRALVAELAAALQDRGARHRPPDLHEGRLRELIAESWPTLLSFLDDEELAGAWGAGAESPRVTALWRAVVSTDLGCWHWRARPLGLTVHPQPPLPAVAEPAQPTSGYGPDDTYRPWLDASLERRLRAALKQGAERVGLPGEADLLRAEVLRATSPLGLLSDSARGVLILQAAIATSVRRGLPRDAPGLSRAARLASTRLERWAAARERTFGSAVFPGAVARFQDDATPVVMAETWRRLHTLEVQDVLPDRARPIWALLQGLWVTAIGRLDWHSSRQGFHLETPALLPVTEAMEWLITHGVTPEELHGFYRSADAADPEDRRTWSAWMQGCPHRLRLEQLIAWREVHRPVSDPDEEGGIGDG